MTKKNTNKRTHIFIQLLTVSRIPIAIIFTYILTSQEHTVGILLSCALLLLSCEFSDLFDGILARRYGLTSEFGAMLDPYADSITRLILYWGLAASSLTFLILPLVMAFRDITVVYCRLVMVKGNVTAGARWSGKIKAGVQATGAFLLLLGPLLGGWFDNRIVAIVSWVIIIVTLSSILEYAKDALKVTMSKIG